MNTIPTSWLKANATYVIYTAFGDSDGKEVIKTTNEYLTSIAVYDSPKAVLLAALINEDPMIVCSLGLQPQGVTMPIRWLDNGSNGYAYIKTQVNPSLYSNSVFESVANMYNTTSYAQSLFGVIGSTLQGTGMYGIICHGVGGLAFRCGTYNTQYVSVGKSATTGITRLRGTRSGSTIELFVDGVSRGTKSAGNPSSRNMYLFRANNADSAGESIYSHIRIANFSFEGDTNYVANFVPMDKITEKGMVDLVTGTFYPNANLSGSFTIEYTLPNGTPWTPGT